MTASDDASTMRLQSVEMSSLDSLCVAVSKCGGPGSRVDARHASLADASRASDNVRDPSTAFGRRELACGCPSPADVADRRGHRACNDCNAGSARDARIAHEGLLRPFTRHRCHEATRHRPCNWIYLRGAKKALVTGGEPTFRRIAMRWKGCSNDTSQACSCTCRAVAHRC